MSKSNSVKKLNLFDMTRLLRDTGEAKCRTCDGELHIDDWVYPSLNSNHQMIYRHASKEKPCAYRVCIISKVQLHG